MSVPLQGGVNQNKTSQPELGELSQIGQEARNTAEAFDDSEKLSKNVSRLKESARSQVEDEVYPVAENEREKSDDEDEEDETEAVEPQAKRRAQVRSWMSKDVNVDLFESFEFGKMEGSGEQNTTNREVDLENLQEASEKWMPANSSNTAILNNQRRFVCVDYPGIVKNKEKAMATLGGVSQIAEARKKESKIELYFRPDDPFCKPAIGSFNKINNLLIKCMRRKAPSDSPSSSHSDGFEYKIEVVGIVDAFFNFNAPADYQFLPLMKEKDGSMRELLSDIILKFEDEREDYLSRDVPVFMPPFTFARHERPAKYYFQPDAVDEDDDDGTSGTARKSRAMGTQLASFKDKKVPKEAKQESLKNLHRYPEQRIQPCVDALKKLFEKRPLWTKSSMFANIPSDSCFLLKLALPTMAYYIMSGPWRSAWCKFGYNPHECPEAKHYQVIEFRLRSNFEMNKIKSSTFGFHHKTRAVPEQDPANGNRLESAKLDDMAAGTSKGMTTSSEMDVKYQFLPWKLPPHRHMFYQVCDIMVDKIQQLVHQNDGKENECTERDGWCVPDFTAQSRDIMTACIENLES